MQSTVGDAVNGRRCSQRSELPTRAQCRTEVAYGAGHGQDHSRRAQPRGARVSRRVCEVLLSICLRTCYVVSGTGIPPRAICVRARAKRCPVLTEQRVVPFVLRDVRYRDPVVCYTSNSNTRNRIPGTVCTEKRFCGSDMRKAFTKVGAVVKLGQACCFKWSNG
eukprot:2416061-Rhodomonas_salina.1